MKPPFHQTRLQQQQQSGETRQQARQQDGATAFESVEELLRHDAAQTTPPPAIAQRLQNSLAREPAQPRPWWRRFFPT